MKKLILILLIIGAGFTTQAQNAKLVNGNYVAVKKESSDSIKSTGKTFTETDGIKYEVFVTKTGKLFVLKVSRKYIKL